MFSSNLEIENIVVDKQIKPNMPRVNHKKITRGERSDQRRQRSSLSQQLAGTGGWIARAWVALGCVISILLRKAISFSLRS